METFILIALVSIGASLLTVFVNKLLVNEKMVDESKKRMKELQEQVKTVTDVKSKEFTQIQDEILDINFKIMKQQMKPTIFTFLPYIFIFYIMAAAFAYAPIELNSNLTVKIAGTGTFAADCLGMNQTINGTYMGNHVLTSENCNILMNGISVNQTLIGQKTIVSQNAGEMTLEVTPQKNKVINLPFELPFLGNSIGWLGTYIICSLVSSLLLNRAFKGKYLRKWG